MRQHFVLDRRLAAAYLAFIVLTCAPAAPVLVPPGAAPVTAEQVDAWVAATAPSEGVLHRFKWLYRDENSSAGGRGTLRIAVPDSLRFDAAGPLGAGRAAAVVVGDSALWVSSEKSIVDLVPVYELLWSMLGIARQPRPEASLTGLAESNRIAWQYAVGADTVSYLWTQESEFRLFAEFRRAGKVLGRTEAVLGPNHEPMSAKLVVPSVPAKLTITYYASIPTPAFPPETWLRSQP